LPDFEAIYRRLGIRQLLARGESFYQERMVALVAELTAAGVLTEEEGRWLYFTGSRSIPFVFFCLFYDFKFLSELKILKEKIKA
jgi:hypothetical protein